MERNTTFVAIDWSGGKGRRHKGIAVARCMADRKRVPAAPQVILPDGGGAWSRRGVADWILDLQEAGADAVIGLDFSFSLPFADHRDYFPGLRIRDGARPRNVRELWRFVEENCAGDADFYGGRMVRQAALAPYFRRPGHLGPRYERRLRRTETAAIRQGAGRAESVFHLIGPSQVGLASFAGMRLLHDLKRRCPAIAVWPWDAPRRGGVTLVEIYSRAFLTLAGAGRGKIRDWTGLDRALAGLGSAPVADGTRRLVADDHRTDALISTAGLRHIAGEAAFWRPGTVSDEVLEYEGWTFGIR